MPFRISHLAEALLTLSSGILPATHHTTTRRIAEGAKGYVRAALVDLEMWMG